MQLPVILVNFKTYPEGRGKRGILLAKAAENVSSEYSVNIAVAPQLLDTINIVQNVEIPVFSQHIDTKEPGSATGHIDPYTLREFGVSGTLLNHSERQINLRTIEEAISIAKDAKLKTLVCAGTIPMSQAVSILKPWAVAMEPPELIGGDVSVTSRPNIVKLAVEAVTNGNPDTLPFIGAGVKKADHVDAAIQLGAKGVLLASGVVKASDPEFVMTEMAKILKTVK